VELEKELKSKDEEVKAKEKSLNNVKSGNACSPEEAKKATENFSKHFKEWKKYKRICWDMANTFTESLTKKPKKFLKDLECDFDSDGGYDENFKEYQEILDPPKRNIRGKKGFRGRTSLKNHSRSKKR